MRLLIITLLTLVNQSKSYSQTDTKKNKSIFFEIGGSGGFGSINYESSFYKKNKTELTWRAGLSFAPIDKNNGNAIIFPVMVNALVGEKSHKLEVGLGQGLTITTKGSPFALTTVNIGYRYQSESSNWFYRVTYTPLISYLIDFQYQQWGGLSIGYTFKKSIK